jgi:hypothetical protein
MHFTPTLPPTTSPDFWQLCSKINLGTFWSRNHRYTEESPVYKYFSWRQFHSHWITGGTRQTWTCNCNT